MDSKFQTTENLQELDYLVFIPGKVINSHLLVKGTIFLDIRWSDSNELVYTDTSGIVRNFDEKLKELKCSDCLKHGIYKSILNKG